MRNMKVSVHTRALAWTYHPFKTFKTQTERSNALFLTMHGLKVLQPVYVHHIYFQVWWNAFASSGNVVLGFFFPPL